ncbi:MAG: hypothetical protein MJ105_04670 [Lachnospiraceae bacterium]|nr:hypothetical protein [Lachnospiraceae bacterium]
MTHKEQCRRLKAIRKTVADEIGVDLHQRECTYEGECSGTCPKCAQEEKILNKALLASAVAATTVMLTACGMEKVPSGVVDPKGGRDVEALGGATEPPINEVDGMESAPPEEVDPNDDYDGGLEYELDGDVAYDPSSEGGEIEYELDGDVVCVDEVDLSDHNVGLTIAKNYSNAPIVEIDSVEENGNYMIHCYEVVEEEDGESHTATWDWIYVDLANKTVTNLSEEEIDYYIYAD